MTPAAAAITAATAPVSAAPAAITAIAARATASSAAAARLVVHLGFFSRPAFEHCLAGQADLAVLVDVGHHHGDFIAHGDHVFHRFTRSVSSWEMCTMPSMLGRISTNAPKSVMRTTLPVKCGRARTSISFRDLLTGRAASAFGGGNEHRTVVGDVDAGAGLFLMARMFAAGR